MRIANHVRTNGRLWLVALIPLLAGWGSLPGVAVETPEPLTRIEDVRRLSREEAEKSIPARITGVIVWQELHMRGTPSDFVVSNGINGIWVGSRVAHERGLWQGGVMTDDDTSPGAQVEIEGVSFPGGYAPVILPTRMKRIGSAPMPQALRPPMELLCSGTMDCSRITLEGVIQDVLPANTKGNGSGNAATTAHMSVDGHICMLRQLPGIPLDAARLVDARVRVTGLFTPLTNYRAEATGLKMLISGNDSIEVLTPPPSDPFLAPKIPLSHILRFSPDASPSHRKVTEGTIVFAVPGEYFFLQDGSSSVRVASDDKNVKTGQRVDVAGFTDNRGYFANLKSALVRPLGIADVPQPLAVTVGKILEPVTTGVWPKVPASRDLNGRAVRMTGRLQRVDWKSPLVPESLRVESEGVLFDVNLPKSPFLSPDLANTWKLGSEVEVSGICEMEFKGVESFFYRPSGFHLWLASPRDVRILHQPPWWTPQRMGVTLASVLLVLALALGWIHSLRRQVARRSLQLAYEISAREAAILEFDAILQERRRLATDLHDTLEQALTGLAFQLEITDRCKSTDPERSARHFHMAQQFLERSRKEVHRTVWDLRAHGLDGRDFLDVMRERADAMVAGSSVIISVEREGEPASIPDFVAGNLLLLAQEAVTNALKHGAPGKIDIIMKFSSEQTALEVRDNGRGFDPATSPGPHDGHFGLQGMHERVKRLGGTLAITSAPGQGTSIKVVVPERQET